MMDYEGSRVRPPSEANSLLLPVTYGCSHNTCTFCGTYSDVKFRIRPLEDIKRDIDKVAANYSWSLRRIFLENGDAVIAPQKLLVAVLKYLKEKFPNLERIGSYATPQAGLIKSAEQLKELHQLGLDIIYLGVETGDEELLKKIDKGATYAQIVEAGRKIKQAGITLSVTVILGLGGVENGARHAGETARILTEMDPDYAGALTLTPIPGTELFREWEEGRFDLITPFDSIKELKTTVEKSAFSNCFFSSMHASNYYAIRGRMPADRDRVLRQLDAILARRDPALLRPEFLRGL